MYPESGALWLDSFDWLLPAAVSEWRLLPPSLSPPLSLSLSSSLSLPVDNLLKVSLLPVDDSRSFKVNPSVFSSELRPSLSSVSQVFPVAWWRPCIPFHQPFISAVRGAHVTINTCSSLHENTDLRAVSGLLWQKKHQKKGKRNI